ncbi:unnamed protein product [Macrosiphum euphorbiae]|uniref:RNA-directed DNA polymerase from mobile element jockey n=1 Tax=Macrosiphum euphorbiae TaxID=13131 RepID=A0AAV0VR51_9HEMI|nr:unnamed protein product [Macrosiphum euphorbiae]
MWFVKCLEEWNNLLDNLKPNDPKLYKIAINLTHKQPQPILPSPPTIQPNPPNEVKSIIKTLSRRKTPGPDGIPNTALRHASNRTILHLTKIFNRCIRLSHIPSIWKHAKVVMIPKPGNTKSDPASAHLVTQHNDDTVLDSNTKTSQIIRCPLHSTRLIRFSPRTFHNNSINQTCRRSGIHL